MSDRLCPWYQKRVKPGMTERTPVEGTTPTVVSKTTFTPIHPQEPQPNAPCKAMEVAREAGNDHAARWAGCRRCGLWVHTAASTEREEYELWGS